MIKHLSIYKLRLSLPHLQRKKISEGLDLSQSTIGVDQQDPKTNYLGMFFILPNHFCFMFDSSHSPATNNKKKTSEIFTKPIISFVKLSLKKTSKTRVIFINNLFVQCW